MLFTASRSGTLLILPLPLSFQHHKAEFQAFLLRYRLFLKLQWLFQNIEKGWRKYILVIFVTLRNCGNFELKDFLNLTFTPCML